jgi:hypothetical protein
MIATLEFRVAASGHFEIHASAIPIPRFIESSFPFSRNPHGQGWPRERPQGYAGFFFALIPRLLAFFCERGIVGGMSESDRNALSRNLAEIDQLIAENEEVLFTLDDDAWTQAEKSLGRLLELRQDLEWELMAQ